jgi:hypothetical protein
VIFPLAAPVVSVLLNGRPVRSYRAPYLRAGRVIAPLEPFVTSVAASIEYSGATIVVRRGDRFSQIPVARQPQPNSLQSTYVAIAPLLRPLGVTLRYDAQARVLFIDVLPAQLATPTPFNPAVPFAPVQSVFTPTPAPTPRPIFTGNPSPRRTPLPYTAPTPRPIVHT